MNLNIPTQAGHGVRATGPPSRASLVVCASGDIDLATAPELDRVLQSAVTAAQPARHLVLDLAAVTFMDCRGLSVLVAARRKLGARFWLANPPAQVLRLLDLAGLTERFAIVDGVPPIALVPGGSASSHRSRRPAYKTTPIANRLSPATGPPNLQKLPDLQKLQKSSTAALPAAEIGKQRSTP